MPTCCRRHWLAEARVPTIAHMVPRGAWRYATRASYPAVDIPVAATNRINTPALAEQMIANNEANLVALARPFLADAEFALKAGTGRDDEINTCIACTRLAWITYSRTDGQLSGEPFAGRELELVPTPRTHHATLQWSVPERLACLPP